MLSFRKMLPVIAVALCILAIGLAGCGGGGGGSSTTGLRVYLVDAPLDADEVNIWVTSVQVHSSESGWVTVKTFDTPLQVNLLDYSGTGVQPLLLADAPLAAGHYTMVRLTLDHAEIVIDGTPHTVDLTNLGPNGIKANGQFDVVQGQLMAIKLDFDASRSFVENPPGSGNFKLQPVLSMTPVNVAAEITGTVAFVDGSSNPLPLPASVQVNVYPAGQMGVADALLAGTTVNLDGTFRIGAIPAATYDVEIVADGLSVKQLPGTVVTAPTTALGTITVAPPAPPGP